MSAAIRSWEESCNEARTAYVVPLFLLSDLNLLESARVFMHEKLVTIAKYHFPDRAQMAKLTLMSKGIDSFLADEFMSSYLPIAIGGIRLQVRESDAERAKEIPRELEENANAEENESSDREE